MKTLLLIMTMGLLVSSSNAQFTKATLQATGLTCAMCNNAINKSLKTVAFVESVKSDISTSSFDITFKPGATVDIDQVKKAVTDAGFSIGSLKLTGDLGHLSLTKDKHVEIGNSMFHFLDTDKENIDGVQTITVVDKDFVTQKQFKKFSASNKMACVQTGKAADCCRKDGAAVGSRVYHVII
jgi:copper chaperone CopZ